MLREIFEENMRGEHACFRAAFVRITRRGRSQIILGAVRVAAG